jgi:hypothetical protein
MRVFVGRTGLLDLVNRLTEVPGRTGRADRPADPPPVLVVEGCGGSGRTALLDKAFEHWHDRTPTALVSPGKLLTDDNSAIRPVLAAVMLGLSAGVPGYEVAFERVLLAEIAIATRTDGLTPDEALDELRAQTTKYRNRGALLDLIRDLAEGVGVIVANLVPPGVAQIVPTVANRVAELVVEPLRKSRRGSLLVWRAEALDWFGHQSQGLNLNPEHARLQLSVQARSTNPAVRRGVDDLLVAALLADLRHSLARAADRPANVLVLLDDGDTEPAASFTSALLRTRQALADTPGGVDAGLPDPLTLVTTSGGGVAAELAGRLPPAALVDEDAVAGAPLTGLWLRVSSRDLRADQVVRLAKNHVWPHHLAAETVGEAVHRLTRGHPESTGYVLRRLQDEPDLVDDLDRLLRRDGPDPGTPVHRHLLRPFVRGLDEGEDDLLDALVTLSAARDRTEARHLVDLLPVPIGLDSALFTSPALWTDGRLHPLVRYLGLRALADDPARWRAAFTRLLDRAGDDETARLRHARLLGDRDAVAARLVDLLPQVPTGTWLELFDAVTAEPDPRERDADVVRAVDRPNTPEGHAFRLLGVVPAVDHDPCWTERAAVRTFRVHAGQGFRQLAEHARDSAPLLLRALAYEGRGRTRG